MGDQSEDIPTKKYAVVINKFNNYFGKRHNIIYDRAKFNSQSQQEGELVEDFIYHITTSVLWLITVGMANFKTKW